MIYTFLVGLASLIGMIVAILVVLSILAWVTEHGIMPVMRLVPKSVYRVAAKVWDAFLIVFAVLFFGGLIYGMGLSIVHPEELDHVQENQQ